MFDSPAERTLTYRLSAAHDCWGHRRALRHGVRNGIWFLDPTGLDEPPADQPEAPVGHREQKLAELVASGRFTPTEIKTLHALVVEQLTGDSVVTDGVFFVRAERERQAAGSRQQAADRSRSPFSDHGPRSHSGTETLSRLSHGSFRLVGDVSDLPVRDARSRICSTASSVNVSRTQGQYYPRCVAGRQ